MAYLWKISDCEVMIEELKNMIDFNDELFVKAREAEKSLKEDEQAEWLIFGSRPVTVVKLTEKLTELSAIYFWLDGNQAGITVIRKQNNGHSLPGTSKEKI